MRRVPATILGPAHSFYSDILSLQGRFDEALREARRAKELDPLSPQADSSLGILFYYMRKYDEALVTYRKMLELNSNYSPGHVYMGRVLSLQGKRQEAIAEMRQAFAVDPHPTCRAWLAYALARAGQRDEAVKHLRKLEAQAEHERVSPVYLARIYIGLGEKELALDWLQKGYDEHSDHVLNIGQDPVYDPLRSDPRFVEMLRGIGLAR